LEISPEIDTRIDTGIQTTLVLAMSADGKIADAMRSPARFGSPQDKAHLENQVTLADAVMFGAGTLRAYGTTIKINSPENLQIRAALGKPPQPIQIVVSRRGEFDSQLKFFSQPVPRWLITTQELITPPNQQLFEKIIVATKSPEIIWKQVFAELAALGIKKLAILGGGELVATLIGENLIDEFWLTICPVIFGGKTSPTPVDGLGLINKLELRLIETKVIDAEIFLHYRFLKD
jgi:5-amino-6-(5-phosphoribosylamino)uracil reductase